MTKRYLLFAGSSYYPLGGWDDFKKSFESLDEARRYIPVVREDWWQIVDTETGQVITE